MVWSPDYETWAYFTTLVLQWNAFQFVYFHETQSLGCWVGLTKFWFNTSIQVFMLEHWQSGDKRHLPAM